MTTQQFLSVVFVFYGLATLLHITGSYTRIDMLMYIFKPLIIPILGLFYLKSTVKLNYLLIFGLFFSFLGDVFLLFNGQLYFMLGLGSFLIAHLFYITIIMRKIKKIVIKRFLISALPFIIFLIVLVNCIYDNLNELLIPVLIYGVIISLFGIVALYNYLQVRSLKTFLMFLGACIFIVSDATIAINKFLLTQVNLTALIMVTYVLAQYLICRSLIEEKIT